MKNNISVIGSGSWGTAIASALAENEFNNVQIVCRKQNIAESINLNRINNQHLPDIIVENFKATTNIEDISNSDYIFIVCPSVYFRETIKKYKQYFKKDAIFVICTKGIEKDTLFTLDIVFKEEHNTENVVIMSGPSFANEVALKKPTALTLTGLKNNTIKISSLISSHYIRTYLSTDLIGVQIGGTSKNILAIACGIIEGKNLGNNAKAAVITRGIHEISKLIEALGGHKDTISGLTGVGDIILTCNSHNSRNMSFGYMLGQGKTVKEILDSRESVTEGMLSLESIILLCEKHNIDAPLFKSIYEIIFNEKPIEEILKELFNRPIKSEE